MLSSLHGITPPTTVLAVVLSCGALLAAVIGACSSFESEADPVPGSHGGDAGAQSDAATNADRTPPPPGAGSAVSYFCTDAGPHDFCADFDQSPFVQDGWSSIDLAGVGTDPTRATGADAPSPPAFMRTILERAGAGDATLADWH